MPLVAVHVPGSDACPYYERGQSVGARTGHVFHQQPPAEDPVPSRTAFL